MAIVYDQDGRPYDDETGEYVRPAVDHSQNPLIGIVLLALVLWLAWASSGAPQIIITGW